jgi:trehalose synthase
MLPKVEIGKHCCAASTKIENYRNLVGDTIVDEILTLIKDLEGVRICHLNATSFGGGVAELLSREMPLLQALGLNIDWRIIHGDQKFFEITKVFHNALQGSHLRLDKSLVETYLSYNKRSAELMTEDYDLYIVHDPQPLALRHYMREGGTWIWRCHIDSSTPNQDVWNFLKTFIEEYEATVFTLEQFHPPSLKVKVPRFILPAIDPLSAKNMDFPLELSKKIMADSGVDLKRPILLQVSRFDPWKDPLGVIKAYRLVKEKRPDVQLVLLGAMAGDDPEGWDMLSKIEIEARHDKDIYVFTNMMGYGNLAVNAFQRGCDLIIQKSLKEGFGLVVSEALWKEKAIVAGRAGGIPTQIPKKFHDLLIDSVEECAEKLLYLLENPQARIEFGKAGREHVQREFLLPRLVRDELRLFKELL